MPRAAWVRTFDAQASIRPILPLMGRCPPLSLLQRDERDDLLHDRRQLVGREVVHGIAGGEVAALKEYLDFCGIGGAHGTLRRLRAPALLQCLKLFPCRIGKLRGLRQAIVVCLILLIISDGLTIFHHENRLLLLTLLRELHPEEHLPAQQPLRAIVALAGCAEQQRDEQGE